MPIKGLTDADSIMPKFPNLGKLRKGGVRKGNSPGEELNYFRFTSKRQEIVDAFQKAYTEKPSVLSVFLPYVNVEDNFSTWMEDWKATSMLHRCDGETCVIWLDGDKYRRDPRPCPGGCKPVGRLAVVLPELLYAGHIGFVTMETHSVNDMISISETLMASFNEKKTLQGIEFRLYRIEQEISTPGWKEGDGRKKAKKWLVKIEPSAEWVRMQLGEKHIRMMGSHGESLLDPELVIDLKGVKSLPPAPENKNLLPALSDNKPQKTAAEIESEINAIGQSLWATNWEGVKNLVYGKPNPLKYVQERLQLINTSDAHFSRHIEKNWSGFEIIAKDLHGEFVGALPFLIQSISVSNEPDQDAVKALAYTLMESV